MSTPIERGRIPDLPGDVRAYLSGIVAAEPPALVALRARTAALPFMAVMQGAPIVGQLLRFLIGVTGARRIIEVGTFTGCSTLAMAAALPDDGSILTIDVNEAWAAIGREAWERSGCADRIALRIGDADAVLSELIADGQAGSFDLVFIDADKDRYDLYFDHALTLLRDHGLMVFDNILFGGRVALPSSGGSDQRPSQPHFMHEMYTRYANGLRRFNERIAHDPRVEILVLPVSDGVTLARKKAHSTAPARPHAER